MSRKLASIQKIKEINPIPDADRIEVATVNGWEVVVKKGLYEEGEKVIYCEVDSFLPIQPEFEFLRKTSYKKMSNGEEGFRLKTIRMRGQISQGLVIPLDDAQTILNRYDCRVDLSLEPIGTDVTSELGIKKYEKPIPAQLEGKVKSYFPSFIKKTDQERIQNLTDEYDSFKDEMWLATEKLDGTSVTYYLKDDTFGVCSRNLDLYETEGNTYWKVARKLDIEEKMKSIDIGGDYALQGEIIGEGIQGNPYKLKGQTVRFFDLFYIRDYKYATPWELTHVLNMLEVASVPYLHLYNPLPDSYKELLKQAEGKSKLNEDVEREGIVLKRKHINPYDKIISFKVISNKFLLND